MQTTCVTTHGLLGSLQLNLVFQPQTLTEARRGARVTRAELHAGSTLSPPLFISTVPAHLLPSRASPSIRVARLSLCHPPRFPRMRVLAEFNGNATKPRVAQHRPHGIWQRPPAPLHFCFLLLLIMKKKSYTKELRQDKISDTNTLVIPHNEVQNNWRYDAFVVCLLYSFREVMQHGVYVPFFKTFTLQESTSFCYICYFLRWLLWYFNLNRSLAWLQHDEKWCKHFFETRCIHFRVEINSQGDEGLVYLARNSSSDRKLDRHTSPLNAR